MLRESHRGKGKVKQHTAANVSHLPMNEILMLKTALHCIILLK